MAVGFYDLAQPLRGKWTPQGFPTVVVMNGRTFKKARWAAPLPFVVAQYREDVDHNSMHLLVKADGNWIIEHVDEANPDRGFVLEHTFRDVIETPFGAFVFSGVVLGTIAGVTYWLTR